MSNYYVYILTSNSRTLYVGMTSDLARRVAQHKNKELPGFTQKYNVGQLVYFEEFQRPQDAIEREKQLKGWRRDKKIALVENENPGWTDLEIPL